MTTVSDITTNLEQLQNDQTNIAQKNYENLSNRIAYDLM